MNDETLLRTASSCRHYAMCKIDYLGTGLCASGPERGFVLFYPQGRMDLYRALARGDIPMTPAALEAADSCSLCGICDKQCYFTTGLRPVAVMRGLKDLAARFRASGGAPAPVADDDFLAELRAITGAPFATNDPAVLVTYSHDPCPVAVPTMPRYAAVPGSEPEVAAIVKLCNEHAMPYAVRGNGSSVMGFVMSDGLVVDLARMKAIEIDRDNWCARVGPGVSAFELQQAASRQGFRANVAEPAALVCANVMCSGIFSTFSAAYGTNADNIVTARFVGRDGGTFSLHEPAAPNLYGYRKQDAGLPGICVNASVKLHPVT
ncbi:MAG: FAD-dependent oxidoreductase, partial [Candidatus Edwardsbacteria bacterium]|nr:FAD-dependent oxidoreductase [Candidatus Edwardsbacteria bacterium]